MNLRRFARSVRGAETIEVAIALPLALIVIFSGLEYGWLMLRVVQVDGAARLGARQAALSGASSEEVEARVNQTLLQSGIRNATVTVTPADLASAEPGTEVRVEVEVGYADVRLLGLAALMPLPDNVSGRASMVREPGS
jgi:Flp pilus assembly protein TadG